MTSPKKRIPSGGADRAAESEGHKSPILQSGNASNPFTTSSDKLESSTQTVVASATSLTQARDASESYGTQPLPTNERGDRMKTQHPQIRRLSNDGNQTYRNPTPDEAKDKDGKNDELKQDTCKSKNSSDEMRSGSQRPAQKQMTKAERRALQEAQRAAKAAAKAPAQASKKGTAGGKSVSPENSGPGGVDVSKGSKNKKLVDIDTSRDQRNKTDTSINHEERSEAGKLHRPTELFSHLPQFRRIDMDKLAENASTGSIPAECVQLGIRMADGSLRGAYVRSMAFLEMLSGVIKNYSTVPGGSFAREFSPFLNSMVAFLVSCRPLNPALGNVIKSVKAELGRLNQDLSLCGNDAQEALQSFVETFMQEKLHFAQVALARRGASQLQNGDVILTYGYSSAVEASLLAAMDAGIQISVIVVDSRPLFEGRTLLHRLLKAGIACDYLLLNAIEIGLNSATKIVVGAAGVMSNGAVLSRVGTAAVCMAGAGAHIPVMVCAESFKFAERVQLESVTYNELGDPRALLDGPEEQQISEQSLLESENLSLLNLMYDATPSEFVSVIVTEIGALPPTSVPAVLREYRSEQQQG